MKSHAWTDAQRADLRAIELECGDGMNEDEFDPSALEQGFLPDGVVGTFWLVLIITLTAIAWSAI